MSCGEPSFCTGCIDKVVQELRDYNTTLSMENHKLQMQINNFLTYSQGGASFAESQLLDKLAVLEQTMEQILESTDLVQARTLALGVLNRIGNKNMRA